RRLGFGLRLGRRAQARAARTRSGPRPLTTARKAIKAMNDLFAAIEPPLPSREDIAPGAELLRGRALPLEHDILDALQAVTAQAPFRHMVTPGGFVMSVAMTNCGAAGWITDRSGYRYDGIDPQSGQP